MSEAPARIGERVEDLDTPALVVDLDAFERNIQTLNRSIAGRVRVRAHAKTHKCPDIALLQVKAGAVGVCCQKVTEAEALVAGGVQDVLVTNELVGAKKVERLAALARHAKIGVCVENVHNIAALVQAGYQGDVYIELEIGMRRCGVEPGEPAVALARSITGAKGLRFAGLHAYHGRAQHVRSMEERHGLIERAAQHVVLTKRLLEHAGMPCPLVTGAGSGTYMLEVETGVWDEIQPGSYIFMDRDYGLNEWAAPLPRFEHSLFVVASVMSAGTDRAIVDAGLKASSVDSGMPGIWQRPGLTYKSASDEHGWVEIGAGTPPPALGEKLWLVPGHCDPTVNLYDWYVCVRGGVVEALWPITARGALR